MENTKGKLAKSEPIIKHESINDWKSWENLELASLYHGSRNPKLVLPLKSKDYFM